MHIEGWYHILSKSLTYKHPILGLSQQSHPLIHQLPNLYTNEITTLRLNNTGTCTTISASNHFHGVNTVGLEHTLGLEVDSPVYLRPCETHLDYLQDIHHPLRCTPSPN